MAFAKPLMRIAHQLLQTEEAILSPEELMRARKAKPPPIAVRGEGGKVAGAGRGVWVLDLTLIFPLSGRGFATARISGSPSR